MPDALTSVLDLIGLLAVALGLGLLVADSTSPGLGFIAGGLVLLAGSVLAALGPWRRGGDE